MPISDKYPIIKYLYNINSINNLPSILEHGLFCKNEVINRGLSFTDVSNPSVQSKRDDVEIPNGYKLHCYVNLYINPRNPMMYFLIKNYNIDDLCVICFDKSVINIPGTIITDGNAASSNTAFYQPEEAYSNLKCTDIWMKSWNDIDLIAKTEKRRKICAEVLVLEAITPKYIAGIIVGTQEAKEKVESLNLSVKVKVSKDIFFQQ